jgi:cob(I)alamin adenosyltransferase
MPIYTRTGDHGETSLAGGTRISKDDPRPEAYGSLDELNACLGLARAACRDSGMDQRIAQIQRELFAVCGELAMGIVDADQPDSAVTDAMVRRFENWIDESWASVPPLTHFILPAGDELACRLHLARTVCRRAERRIVSLSRTVPVANRTRMYVNRLSDLLFAWARQANHVAGVTEEQISGGAGRAGAPDTA